MKLPDDLEQFLDRWADKAKRISLNEVGDYFDKFFTLFVIYNRLYATITFWLGDSGRILPRNSGRFCDREAATEYVVDFIGAENLMRTLEADMKANEAIGKLKIRLADKNHFFKLHGPRAEPPKDATGKWLKDDDRELLKRLESNNTVDKARALLEVIYSVRCNTFHGSKILDSSQIETLQSINTLLEEALIPLIRSKLEAAPEPDTVRSGARGEVS